MEATTAVFVEATNGVVVLLVLCQELSPSVMMRVTIDEEVNGLPHAACWH